MQGNLLVKGTCTQEKGNFEKKLTEKKPLIARACFNLRNVARFYEIYEYATDVLTLL